MQEALTMPKVLTKTQTAKLAKLTRAHVEATDDIDAIPGNCGFATKFRQATPEQRDRYAKTAAALGEFERELVRAGLARYEHGVFVIARDY